LRRGRNGFASAKRMEEPQRRESPRRGRRMRREIPRNLRTKKEFAAPFTCPRRGKAARVGVNPQRKP